MMSDKERTMKSLKDHIQICTGLHLFEKDAARLEHVILDRIHALSLPDHEAYLKYLEGNHPDEWNTLKITLTSAESSFFRDKGQIELLHNHILPELIERKAGQRQIRLWSAGCSTGQEPYTLAMLLDHLLPQHRSWRITIMGTDINDDSLLRATQGIYSHWTLRGVDQSMLERYFSQDRNGWRLSAGIMDMVQFRKVDLLEDSLPDRAAGLSDMDLILCRNLFIYYDSKQVAAMVEKLGRCLNQDGYLLTGHAEVPADCQHGLNARIFPESVIYQRTGRATPQAEKTQHIIAPAPQPPPRIKKPATPTSAPPTQASKSSVDRSEAMHARAETYFMQGAYLQARNAAQSILAEKANDIEAAMIAANACANMGQHEDAERFCRQAADINPMRAEPYYLMAQLSQAHHDFARTRQLLNKVIYLSPGFAPAYLELASVYEREGSAAMARKMRSSALEILEGMPPDTTIAEYETISVKQLLEHVRGMLE